MSTHKEFEKMLAAHSAPTLAGKKPANLVSFDTMELEVEKWLYWYAAGMKKRGVYFRELCDCGRRRLVLIYHKELLQQTLRDENIRSYLYGCGYEGESLSQWLDYLARRVTECNGFPHEIGLFLGYPIGDVLGFIENSGKNYKMAGYWKVYEDEKKAKELFDSYTSCKNMFSKLVGSGKSIMCLT